MTVAGFDVGARFVKVALLDEASGALLALYKEPTRFDPCQAADLALEAALDSLLPRVAPPLRKVACGSGAAECPGLRQVTDLEALVAGLSALDLSAGLLLDVGAETSRALRFDAQGKVSTFITNDKCASGVGAYVESMARVLEVSLTEMDDLALRSISPVRLSAQCAVFAESEVVSLLHRNVDPADIARAIFESLANQGAALVRRAGLADSLLVCGGMAANRSYLLALARLLAPMKVSAVPEPLMLLARGAALLARNDAHDEGRASR